MQLYIVYSDITTGDHHANNNLLPIERNTVIRHIHLLSETFLRLLGKNSDAMRAAQQGDAVSFGGLDHLGYFEPYQALSPEVINDEGSADPTYSIHEKVDQKCYISKDWFRSPRRNRIVQSYLTIQEKHVNNFLSISYSSVQNTYYSLRETPYGVE